MKTKTSNNFSPEVRERAVLLVREFQGEYSSQWTAIQSIAAKIDCTAETLRRWVRQAEKDSGERDGLTTAESMSDSRHWNAKCVSYDRPTKF
jgi:transposase